MKKCPKCSKEHDQQGRFCSRSCANSRTWTKEHKENLSESVKRYAKMLTEEEKRCKNEKISLAMKHSLKDRKLQYLLETEFDSLAIASKRIRIILEQKFSCLICGITEWQGQPVNFELDHIDGNNKNDRRENLRILCPNCHSMTDTWRGRKNRVRETRLTEIREICGG